MKKQQTKILLTGSTGFIGSFLLERLLEEKYNVKIIKRKSSNTQFIKHLNVESYDADLNDKDKLPEIANGCDIVVHVAGLTSAKNHIGYIQGNKTNTKNLLDSLDITTLKKFIYISSLTAVGPSNSLNNPVNELSDYNPITSYGVSKMETEKMIINDYSHIPYIILRPPAVFGPRDKAILTVFQSIKYGIAPMMGLNDKYISLIYVKDLVEAIISTIESEHKQNQIYFVSSGKYYNWSKVINLISNLMGKKPIKLKIPEFLVKIIAAVSELLGKFSAKPPVFNIDKGKDLIQDFWICDNTKAINEINFVENYDLETALAETIEWYKKNKWL